MTLPAGFPYPLNQEVQIPLEQVIPNPNQPRQFEHPEEIQLLAASMKAKGQEVAARVRPLTEAERAAHPGAWVMLIGGHGRREAALLNQFKTLKCTIEDITPEEAISAAARDNNIRDMHWWEWYLVIEQVDKASQKTQREIANELGQSITRVNWALKITKTLNPAARALVKENLQKSFKNDVYDANTKNKDFSITERTLLTLAGLENPDQVQQALQAVLDDYLTPDQAKQLVAWVQAGHPAGEFSTRPTPTKAAPKPAHTDSPSTDSVHAGAQPISGPAESASSNNGSRLVVSTQTTSPQMGSAETALYEAVAGLSVITKIRSKIKKGERPTLGERFILFLDFFYRIFAWIGKHSTKIALWFIKMIGHMLKKGLKVIFRALGRQVEATLTFVVSFAVVLLFIWLAWDMWTTHLDRTKHFVKDLVPHVGSPVAKATPPAATPVVSAQTPSSAVSAPVQTPTVQSAEAVPTTVTEAPTKVVAQADSDKESAHSNNGSQPLASANGHTQQTPTTKPQGDLLTQAAGAAPGVAQAADGVKRLFGL